MPLITILIVLLLVGFGLWLLQFAPLDGTVKTIIRGAVIIIVIIWLLQSIGMIGSIGDIRIR